MTSSSMVTCDYCEKPYSIAVERGGKRLRYCNEHWFNRPAVDDKEQPNE